MPRLTSISSSSTSFEDAKAIYLSPQHYKQSSVMTTSFTKTISTPLRFSAFPPQSLLKRALVALSKRAAITGLNDTSELFPFSPIATAKSKITQIEQFPSSIVAQDLNPSAWEFFSIATCLLNPLATHHIAIRELPDGVEKLVIGPAGFVLHSICSVQDWDKYPHESPFFRESLHLEETFDVICPRALRWWFEKVLTSRIAEDHELLRQRWDSQLRKGGEVINGYRGPYCTEKSGIW